MQLVPTGAQDRGDEPGITKFVADDYVEALIGVSGKAVAGKFVYRNAAVVAKHGVASFGCSALVVLSNKGFPWVTYSSGLPARHDHYYAGTLLTDPIAIPPQSLA